MTASPSLQAASMGTPPVATAARGGGGWRVMWRIETAKLAAQMRARVGVAACLLGPVAFAVAMAVQDAVPADTLFGRWVHESGFADPLVILSFSGQWVIPGLVTIVAGDMFSAEDRSHTWTLILTRSRTRGEVLAGKALTAGSWAVLVVVLLALSSVLTGMLAVGTQPLVGLSGALLPSSTALAGVVWSWLTAIPPALAVTAIAMLLSVLARKTWAGLIGPLVLVLALNLLTQLSFLDPVRPFLPTTGFEAWHGLMTDTVYTGPIVWSVVVSAAWVVACVGAMAVVLARRDVVDA